MLLNLNELYQPLSNLLHVGVLSVAFYGGSILSGLLKEKIKNEALKRLYSTAENIVTGTFQQIIKPSWEVYKNNPQDETAKGRYEESLQRAKRQAVNELNDHLTTVPQYVSEKLVDKVSSIIESTIPKVKSKLKGK